MNPGKYFDHILGEQNPTVKDYILNHEENKSEKNVMDRIKIGLKIEMWEYLNSSKKSDFIPTGHFLNRLLGIYRITKTKFSEFIDIERTNLQAVIKGKRRFNSSLAKKVEQIFEIPADLWLHIETKNDLIKYEESNKNQELHYSLKELMKAS
jgi:plasmid maintenance system antidote protein VapI